MRGEEDIKIYLFSSIRSIIIIECYNIAIINGNNIIMGKTQLQNSYKAGLLLPPLLPG